MIPDGRGKVNSAGLDFYDRLIDALLEASVKPLVTLFHWDYPQALFCRGGWLNPSSSDWFAEYTEVIVRRLGDRVHHWMTFNEPTFFIWLGHWVGINAPGVKLAQGEVLQVMHNALLAHGKSVQVIRAASPVPSKIGVAFTGFVGIPTNDTKDEIELARKMMFKTSAVPVEDQRQQNSLIMDPVFFGKYPDDAEAAFGKFMPQPRPGDMETIRQPLDFLGYNLYEGRSYIEGADGKIERIPVEPGAPRTAAYWEMKPEICYWGPRFLFERYKMPIIITENGVSCADWVMQDGKVHDPERIDFTRRHLLSLRKAYQEGIPVIGYQHWTILDNFEWHLGYSERFGLIYVDFQTQKQILKDSARWYGRVISSKGSVLDDDVYTI